MAPVKATFTLDEPALVRPGDAAARLRKPKSAVAREALQEYHERIGKLREAHAESLGRSPAE